LIPDQIERIVEEVPKTEPKVEIEIKPANNFWSLGGDAKYLYIAGAAAALAVAVLVSRRNQ